MKLTIHTDGKLPTTYKISEDSSDLNFRNNLKDSENLTIMVVRLEDGGLLLIGKDILMKSVITITK